MQYRWSVVPFLFTSVIGRRRLAAAARHYAWPVVAPIASLYRRTVLRNTSIVTITGSFGKTTTARCVLAALEGREDPRIGGNSWTNQALALLRTPPSASFCVIEVGIAHLGEMAVFAKFHRPDMVIVTGIGSEHNRSFGTLETTREEKVKLVRAVRPGGTVILNGDDSNVRWMATQTEARIITYGFGEDNQVRADQYTLEWPRGSRIRVTVDGESRDLRSRLLGRHQVYPILAAVAAAWSQGISPREIQPALGKIEPVRGRMEVRRLDENIYMLCDDFKSSPETIEAALDTLKEIPASRKLVALGDVSEPPGSQGPVYRHLGRRIAETADEAVLLGGSVQRYRVGAKQAGMPVSRIQMAGKSVIKAAEMVREIMRPGDVILIKGRDTQRLERIALILEGRTVKCDIPFCRAKRTRCFHCHMLESGWEGKRVLT